MKLDFTISIGDLIAALTFSGAVVGSAWAVVRKFNQFIFIFREFPPHRHMPSGEIAYPKGMKPGVVQEASHSS